MIYHRFCNEDESCTNNLICICNKCKNRNNSLQKIFDFKLFDDGKCVLESKMEKLREYKLNFDSSMEDTCRLKVI